MNKALSLAVIGLGALAACGQRPDPGPGPVSSDEKVNADSSVAESPSGTPPAQADAEDPKTGTNEARPDSPRDLKPGTDGNTNPPRP
jgi:hypothetical protein